jgi:hypothetical protein
MTAADFNGDGFPDLAVSNYNGGTVSVLLNRGDGTLLPAVNYASGPSPFSILAEDLGGDGRLDLVVANGLMGNTTLSILRGNGDGTFLGRDVLTVGNWPSSVVAGDFNGDNAPDLAVALFGSNSVAVLLNTALPVTVAGVQVNDGSAQRSSVSSLTVTFSRLVSLDDGAFEVRNQAGDLVPLEVSTYEDNGKTVAVLTFTGPDLIGGSLADGNYFLTIRADHVHDTWGHELDGDGDGIPGGDYTMEFYRLYGDTNGDRTVDRADRTVFRSTFGRHAGDPGFLAYLDYNGDGVIDGADWAEFRARYGTVLLP